MDACDGTCSVLPHAIRHISLFTTTNDITRILPSLSSFQVKEFYNPVLTLLEDVGEDLSAEPTFNGMRQVASLASVAGLQA